MSTKRTQFRDEANRLVAAHGEDARDQIAALFTAAFPVTEHAGTVFDELWDSCEVTDLPQIAEQTLALFARETQPDEPARWDYDAVEFMIELAKRHRLPLPKAVLEGLPEQTILLVDKTLLV